MLIFEHGGPPTEIDLGIKNPPLEGPVTVTLPPNNSVRIGYTDKVIEAVLNKIKTRADIGMVKYGMSMEGNTGDMLYWLNHAQQEAMDCANYLEKLIQMVEDDRNADKAMEIGG